MKDDSVLDWNSGNLPRIKKTGEKKFSSFADAIYFRISWTTYTRLNAENLFSFLRQERSLLDNRIHELGQERILKSRNGAFLVALDSGFILKMKNGVEEVHARIF